MKKFWFQIIGLLIVIFGALLLNQNPGIFNMISPVPIAPNNNQQAPTGSAKIRIIGQSGSDIAVSKAELVIEIADTKEERASGLGGRTQLGENNGMLFIFEKSDIHKFWMKGMKIPIDFIWINQNRVVDILPSIQPPQPGTADKALLIYAPVVKADSVLEVNAGFAASKRITIGDTIEIVR